VASVKGRAQRTSDAGHAGAADDATFHRKVHEYPLCASAQTTFEVANILVTYRPGGLFHIRPGASALVPAKRWR
jgi:hypothetical protein